jgi:hypothetical protein
VEGERRPESKYRSRSNDLFTSLWKLRTSLTGIVLIHLVVVLWHAAAHARIPVPMTMLQAAFVGLVIVILPLVGVTLLWGGHKQLAAWLIASSMFGSLLFGIVNHFVLVSPDYVLAIPAHAFRHSFVLSAALLAVTETIGTVLAFVALQTWL